MILRTPFSQLKRHLLPLAFDHHGHDCQEELLGLEDEPCLASALQCRADNFDTPHDPLLLSFDHYEHVRGQQDELLGLEQLEQVEELLREVIDAQDDY